MIDLPTEHLEAVRRILAEHVPWCEVRAFGSRTDGTAREYSDLDLALVGDGKLDWSALEALKDAFSASDLPIAIDVVDWHAISPEFRAVIERGYEVLRKGASP
ncbi:MAG: nucleotidyltransferase domain-containing protein [Polyangia bacterium]